MSIQLRRSDRYAVHLVFAPAAIDSLIAAFRGASTGEPVALSIEFDRGVVKGKRHDELVMRKLVVEAPEEEEVSSSGDTVHLRLDADTLDYGIEKLMACRETGAFDPPEFCELRAGKRTEPDDLYCIVRREAACIP